jgi:hypothetical protein
MIGPEILSQRREINYEGQLRRFSWPRVGWAFRKWRNGRFSRREDEEVDVQGRMMLVAVYLDIRN